MYRYQRITVRQEREKLPVRGGQDETEFLPRRADEPTVAGIRPGGGCAGRPVDVTIPIEISVCLDGVNNSVAAGYKIQEPLLWVVSHVA
jgi:hypothetical protein